MRKHGILRRLRQLMGSSSDDSPDYKRCKLLYDFLRSKHGESRGDISASGFVHYLQANNYVALFPRDFLENTTPVSRLFHDFFTRDAIFYARELIYLGCDHYLVNQVMQTGTILNYANLYRAIRLIYACSHQLELADLLCLSGEPAALQYVIDTLQLSPDAKGCFGRSLLHYAVLSRSIPQIKLALKLDVDINARDQFGQTPLMLAAMHGMLPELKLLIARKADLQCRDNSQHSALYYAIAQDHMHVAVYLLNKGALADAETKKLLVGDGIHALCRGLIAEQEQDHKTALRYYSHAAQNKVFLFSMVFVHAKKAYQLSSNTVFELTPTKKL